MQKLIKNVLNTLKNQKFISILFIIICIFLIIITGKFIKKKPPIKIGIACTLTGSPSTGIIYTRDTAILVVEEINKKGGINGRMVELVIKDDKFDPEEALLVDQELIDEGVVAIVGHTSSTLCLKVAPLINQTNIVMLTNGALTDKLTGIDDNFIRVGLPMDKSSKFMAHITLDKLKIQKMAIVYDFINLELSKSTLYYYQNEFKKLGGEILDNISFNSKEKFSAVEIAKKIIQSNAEGVYIIANAIHTALICQHLKRYNKQIKIIAHGWAFIDPVFIKTGGHAIEGVIGLKFINTSTASEQFLEFIHKYQIRFGEKEISELTALTYEEMQILYYALSMTNDQKKIKGIILEKKIFNGAAGKIIFDKYGDPTRTLYIMQIQNGRPEIIGITEPEELLEDDK